MSTRADLRRKAVAVSMACTLALSHMVPAAHASSTDISDVPLPVKNRVAPNIMLTFDRSNSMMIEYLPEEDMGRTRFMFPMPQWTLELANFNDNNIHNFYTRSSHNNKQFYNPDVTYRPWVNSDGTPWPQANPEAALYSPTDPGLGSLNLVRQRTEAALWHSDVGTGNRSTWECDPAPCGSNHSFWPITYFKYNGSGSVLARTSYTKVEIRNTTPANTRYGYRLPDGTPAERTKEAEIQNFANWFVYHRSRMQAARAGISRVFSTLGDTARVGLAATNEGPAMIDGVASPGTMVRGVRPFTGAYRREFYDLLFTLPFIGGTPLRRAVDDVGQYFKRTDHFGPWGENPGLGGGTQLSCRQNFQILVTDGYWNEGAARVAAARANVDGSRGPTHESAPDPLTKAVTTYTYTPQNPWQDDWSNTLADVAMYYWVNDLRPGTDMPNNVFTSETNPAFWQHLTTYGIALGVFGTIPKAKIEAALGPSPEEIKWQSPHTGPGPYKIDDLAHAAVNSRGLFYSAADPEEFAIALAAALDNIGARTSAGAAVGVSSPILVPGNDLLFASSYMPGSTWSGELAAYAVDSDTGAPSATPKWTAQRNLDGLDHNERRIVSYDGSRGVRFRPPGGNRTLTGAQRDGMRTPGVTPPDGDAVIRYLRGDRSGEHSGTYRRRAHVLGDIVNAQPILVSPPAQTYGDPGYAAFKAAHADRGSIVLQGANDGMLHAFDAENGKELWAYVPTFVFPNLNNLTRRLGYTHKFYVDATPFAGDIDFNRTSERRGNPDWRTIVVGGLGKGGRGFYALNVTDTQARDERDAANKVLWEFPSAHPTHAAVKANVGYSFGRPIITKTRAEGWVVLVTSGYNNGRDTGGDGRGYLFVLDAGTGALIRAIATPHAGSPDNPSGFAHIAAYSSHASVDNTVDYVYGGDLLGNVWRFDLSGNSRQDWKVSKLATLVDSNRATQPVTTEPELARIRVGNTYKHFVYVGTGRFLGDTDIPNAPGANRGATQTQTIYGLVDDLTGMEITDLRRNLLRQTLTDTGDRTGNRVASRDDLDFTKLKGWYVDLPGVGERITAPPALATGTLVFTSNIPSSDPCVLGGHAYYNLLDYRTGGYRVGEPTLPSSIRVNQQGLASGITFVQTRKGIRGIVRTTAAETFVGAVPRTGAGAETKRRLWKELRR